MALKQNFAQKQEQRLSPQQIQLMKLLEVPTMELESRIKQEIEENPALEEGEDKEDEFEDQEDFDDDVKEEDEFDIEDYLSEDAEYKTQVNNKGKDDEDKSVPISSHSSFQDRINDQLHMLNLSDLESIIAETIVGNLDDSGYLNREIDAIVDDLAFSQNLMADEADIERVLLMIQDFDPAGIGARDLRECLMIQLKRKQDGDITKYTALKILEDHFEEFTKKHYSKIVKKLEISDDDLKEAIEEIVKLNPKPGGSSKEAERSVQQVIPDFEIVEQEGKLLVYMNGRNAPELKVSKTYKNMLMQYAEGAKASKADKEALTFVKQKLDGAKWFIDAIKQRQNTLMVTMKAILDYQYEFFETGDETKLNPMILKDIAEKVGLDISTISRVANSKHVITGFGVYPLKYFFSESLSTSSGEEVSTREVKKILQDAVEGEEKRKPLTDEKLAALLKEKGYNIARRTVAKYREQLNIPVARLRKEL